MKEHENPAKEWPPYVILFDGVCNLCNASVSFIIDRDPAQKIRFASLQSDFGQQVLGQLNMPTDQFHSLILLEKGRAYQQSTGALRIARLLSGAWPLWYAFIIVPAFLRNPIYNIIAANRYKWFGKKDECRLPTPELRERFIA